MVVVVRGEFNVVLEVLGWGVDGYVVVVRWDM